MADVKRETKVTATKAAKTAATTTAAAKKTAVKAEPKKEAAKVATVKKVAAPAKKVETKVEVKKAETKTEVKKTAKKPAAKKAAKKTVKKAVERADKYVVQSAGNDLVDVCDVKKQIEDNFVKEGHRVSTIKSLDVYFNLDENKAYYVINGKEEGKYVEF